MDRLTRNRKIVIAYLKDWVDYHPDQQTGIPLEIIVDERKGHIILLENGWSDGEYVYEVFVHFLLKEDGELIVISNQTDQDVFAQLVEAGIKKTDIGDAWDKPRQRPGQSRKAA